MKKAEVYPRLKEALETGEMIRLQRTFDTWSTFGPVVGLSKKWMLIHEVCSCHFDGWQAIRLADIKSIESDPTFVPQFMKQRGQNSQAQPLLDLTNVASILKTAHLVFPLVTIELEKLLPETSYVGQVDHIDRSHVWLSEITPAAVWNRTRVYPLKKITKVYLGDEFCNCLWEIAAGSAPKKL
jgi:hypothetical protein